MQRKLRQVCPAAFGLLALGPPPARGAPGKLGKPLEAEGQSRAVATTCAQRCSGAGQPQLLRLLVEEDLLLWQWTRPQPLGPGGTPPEELPPDDGVPKTPLNPKVLIGVLKP